MSIRVGIVGISGFGGGEAMRLVAGHPSFELVYAAGEGSAGSRLGDLSTAEQNQASGAE
jgi:N-acetyl-gamma-glutamyl-phosphate reductase